MKPGKNQLTDVRCLRGQNTAVKQSRREGVGGGEEGNESTFIEEGREENKK